MRHCSCGFLCSRTGLRAKGLPAPAALPGSAASTNPFPLRPTTPLFHADSAFREVGLCLAVAGMRRGERARVWVPPEMGYGAAGSFSFPTVPPAAHLVYDLRLLAWEQPDDSKVGVGVGGFEWTRRVGQLGCNGRDRQGAKAGA